MKDEHINSPCGKRSQGRNLEKEVPKAFRSWDQEWAGMKKGRVGDEVGEAEATCSRKEKAMGHRQGDVLKQQGAQSRRRGKHLCNKCGGM